MLSMRKRLIIIGAMVIAVIAIIIAIFACSNKWDDGYSFGGGKNKQDTNTCTVIFNEGLEDYSFVKFYEVTVDKGSTVQPPSSEPTRPGYIFRGWNTTGNPNDPMWYFDFDKITADTTLRAVWAVEVTVRFFAGHNVFEDGSNQYFVTVAKGDKLIAPAVTSPDPYTRLHYWSSDYVARWDFDRDVVYSDMTLYAQWDLKHDLLIALEPFLYSKTANGINIDGVVDKNVSGTLTVPSCVTSISSGAFINCHNLESVIIADSVTNIYSSAFQNCEKLKSVTLPSGLTSIESAIFSGCTSLERVNIGDNVTTIGGWAFYGCTSLTDIQIPKSVTELDDRAFLGCTSLKSIIIPASCDLSGDSIFKDCIGLISAELHCETVGQDAFCGCTALTDVTFGAEVRTIGSSAFYKCTALAQIEIPDTVTELTKSAFYNCSALRNVTIGNGVEAIHEYTFFECYDLRSVTIGSSVKSIDDFAFYSCISLLSITIPSNVETIEENAFLSCYKIVEVYNLSEVSLTNRFYSSQLTVHTDASEESVIHYTQDGFSFGILNDRIYPFEQMPFLMDYWGDDEEVVLPDSYNGEDYKIFQYALAYKSQLNSVKISAGVKDVGGEILRGSDNVTSLTVDDENAKYHSAGNCVIDSDKCFILGCKTSVIPTDGSVTSIGSNVFCHNATITEFSIPDSVTKIYRDAFNGCDGITRTVRQINYVDKWAVSLVNHYNGDGKVDLEFQSGTVGIINMAFYGSSRVLSVKFNDEMRYVGSKAFSNCAELTAVTFNKSIFSIDGYAFEKCTKLQEIVLPDSVDDLGYGVFENCTALTYAKLSASLIFIDRSVFSGCSALQAVVIPQSVQEINYAMLSRCPETVRIYYCGNEEQWNAVNIDNSNDVLINATKYFYSETEIEGENCWHYGADGKPTIEYQ